MTVTKIWKQNELFKVENQILKEALRELEDDNFQGNPLLSRFEALTRNYGKLLRQTIKLLKISDSQQRNLQKIQQDMRNLLDNAGQGFLTFSNDLIVDNKYSAECLNIFGTKIEGQNIVDLAFNIYSEEQKTVITELLRSVWEQPNHEENMNSLQQLPTQVEINTKKYRLEYRPIQSIRDNKGENLIMMVITDVTERHQAEQQINYLSFYDKLTGLYNRTYIDTAFANMNDEDNLPVAMIIGDVNGLKITNDVFGHLQGDHLLQNIAMVLRKCLRGNDLIARWGGDEFLVILPCTDEKLARTICKRIKDTLAQTPADPIKLSMALGMAIRRNRDQSYAEIFNRAEEQMYKNKLQEKPQVHRNFLQAVNKTLWDRSPENEEHVARMKKMARAIAEKLGCNANQIRELEELAFMHDIGKVAVASEILNKPDSLDEVEWETVKKHCEIGYRMSQALSKYQLADYILNHHENWDGTGYPHGVKGPEIPLPARIIAVVDAYDIMTHDMPYKGAITPYEALAELKRCSGTQFDPQLVQILEGIL